MDEWIALKQALTAVDVVMRRWARELGVDGADLTVLLMLGKRKTRAVSDIAYFIGRHRQQVQRTMEGLARRGLVEAVVRDATRRTQAWSLTPEGQRLLERLQARTEVWRGLISSRVDLGELIRWLEWTVEAMVNQPSADGWGLTVPDVVRRDPRWDLTDEEVAAQARAKEEDARLEAMLDERLSWRGTQGTEVEVEAVTSAGETARPPSSGKRRYISDEEHERLCRQFHALWNS